MTEATPRRIFVVDTETAGIDLPVLEIGVIEINHELEIVQEWESLIDPQCAIKASASAVHGLLYKDVAAAPTLDQWARMTPNPLRYSGAVKPWVVAHKIRFDAKAIGAEMPVDYGSVCSLKLARKFIPKMAEEGENHQLQTLCYYLNLFSDPILSEYKGEAHRVGYDIRCVIALMRWLRNNKGLTTQQILAEGSSPYSLDTPMWFGKHAGELTLRQLPSSYVAWCQRQTEMDEDLLEALAQRA